MPEKEGKATVCWLVDKEPGLFFLMLHLERSKLLAPDWMIAKTPATDWLNVLLWHSVRFLTLSKSTSSFRGFSKFTSHSQKKRNKDWEFDLQCARCSGIAVVAVKHVKGSYFNTASCSSTRKVTEQLTINGIN